MASCPKLTQSFNGVVDDIRICIAESVHQGRNSARILLLAEGKGSLYPEVCVRTVEELDERAVNIDIAEAKHLQRAVQQSQIAMIVANRN